MLVVVSGEKIQIILNSIFDRQTASICINNSVSDNSWLTNYIGNVNISTSDGKNTLSSTDDNITIGNSDANVSIDAQNVTLNGNSLNTPNGFVTLNNVGFIDNQFISLQFDPKNLSVVQNVFALPTDQVQITIKNSDGTYQAITLQQLATLCYPQLQYL